MFFSILRCFRCISQLNSSKHLPLKRAFQTEEHWKSKKCRYILCKQGFLRTILAAWRLVLACYVPSSTPLCIMVAKLYQYSHCYPSSFMFNIIYLECLTIIRLIADQYLSVPQYPAAIRIFACASISCCYPDICPCLNILPLSGYLPAP